MPAAGFEPAIPTSQRSQTRALGPPATGIGGPAINVAYLDVCYLSMLSVARVIYFR
jgi:hypothetical protein